jgi:hypothetical protein
VERRVDVSNLDLDVAMQHVERRQSEWEANGVHLVAVTWMDNEADWPRPLLTDRAQAHRPMSLGIRLAKKDGSEAEVVLYAGGWADFIVWIGDDANLSQTYEELDGPDQFGDLLDRHLSGMMTER